jgi:methionyl-tRNA formyltransferase
MPRERLPITHFVELLFDRLTSSGGELSFEGMLAGSRDRTYVIGAFLALLELIKLRKILVMQDGFGDIRIQIREEGMELDDTVDQDLASHTIEQPQMGGSSRVRVVFMGSPAFAVPLLQSLVGAGMAPVLVVTPPPRPSGRGRRKREVAVAEEAERLQLPVHRTGDVNGRTSREAIEETTPDVIVTAGFGQKLGSAILTVPRHGCVNVHTSLLPKYRGASPVAAAIRDGATETGVTLFKMDEEWDQGPILAMAGIPLTGEETRDEVTAALSKVGADLLVRTLPDYVTGELELQPQPTEGATYARRLRKEEGKITWSEPAITVKNHVRAMTSWPGAQTSWQPKVKHEPLPVVIAKVELLSGEDLPPVEEDAPVPGTVLRVSPEGIDVQCGEGAVRITRIRPSGGREMAVKDFLNARRVVAGDRLV